MSPRMTSSKRFAVRTALVTSTTLATIMGAQALVSIDGAASSQAAPAPAEFASQPTAAGLPQTSGSDITAAAPNIVILRRAGEQPASAQAINPPATNQVGAPSAQIVPPNAVVVAPPQPFIQLAIPSTEASR